MSKEEVLKAVSSLGVHERRELLIELLPQMCQWAIYDSEFREKMMQRCGMSEDMVNLWLENVKNLISQGGKSPCCK